MEWVCMLIGLFVGYLLGALSPVNRGDDTVNRILRDSYDGLKPGERAYFSFSASRDAEEDDGDVFPDPVFHQDWRSN